MGGKWLSFTTNKKCIKIERKKERERESERE